MEDIFASFERVTLKARWRDGRMVWWQSFQSESEALEALSLPE